MLRILLLLTSAVALLAQVPPSTDPQIEAQIHDRLAKSLISKDGFVAKVKAGVVYWEGTTSIAQHKGAATRIAKSAGARRVVNNIKVKKPGGSPAAPPKPVAQLVPDGAHTAAPPPSPTAPTPPASKNVTVKWRPSQP